jgi:RNA polymerase sigma-70 factor (sigma-E family)
MGHGPPGFEDFVRTRYSALARTAFLLTGDRGQAEDLVQASLAATLGAWDRVAVGAAEAYTRKTLVRLAHRSRKRRWRGEVPTELADLPAAVTPATDLALALDTRALMAALPWEQRAVLVLRFFDDLSERETARVLGCSVGTVKSRTSRAVARMRAVLLNDQEVPSD